MIVIGLETGQRELLARVKGFSTGPGTTQTATAAGIRVLSEDHPHRISALVNAIENYFKEQ